MFRLTRYFSIMSLIAFIIVTVILALFYRQAAINDLITLREDSNVALAQVFANSLWLEFAPFVNSASELDIEELQNHPETTRLREAVFTQLDGLSVVKIKVYDLNALTVFSTEVSQIGEDKSDNAGYQAALSGEVATELTHRDTFSAFEQTIENRDVISSYVPIQPGGADGSIEAVFEIYDDVTPFLQRIERTRRDVVIGVVIILTILYAVLFVIVLQGDRIIIRQSLERVQLLEELVSDLSHDIKTPLASIKTFLYLIKRQSDPDKRQHYMEQMESQIQRLSQLVEDILTMSRLDKGANLVFAPLDLNRLVQDIVESYHNIIDMKEIKLDLDLYEFATYSC